MKSLYWAKKGLFSKETVVLCRWGIEIQRFGFIIKQSGEIWIGQGRGIQKLTLGRSIFLSAMNDITSTITYFQEMS